MTRLDFEHEQHGGAMRRFTLLGQATLAVMVMLFPVVMIKTPYFSLLHQLCIAFELAGIAVMSIALIWGSGMRLMLWWRDMEEQTLREMASRR